MFLESNSRKAHDDLALKMAHKSMTLLKNEGILPLNKNLIKKIAVIGPNAVKELKEPSKETILDSNS